MTRVFDELILVVNELKIYRTRQNLGDRASSLVKAQSLLEEIRSSALADTNRRTRQSDYGGNLPEDNILSFVLKKWIAVVTREIQLLQGAARLHFELSDQPSPVGEECTVTLRISNTGRCPADNVRVILEAGDTYDVIGSNECTIEKVPTSQDITTEFVIRPRIAP